MSQWEQQVLENAEAIRLILDNAKKIGENTNLSGSAIQSDKVLIERDGETFYATVSQLVSSDVLVGRVISEQPNTALAKGDPIRHDGTKYIKGNATTDDDADVFAIVTESDESFFTFNYGGLIDVDFGLANGEAGFLQDDGSVGSTPGTIEVYLGRQTPRGFLIEIDKRKESSSGGSEPIVVETATYTPSLNDTLHTVVTTTITDPSPQEGRGYVTKVVNGTTTIGGVDYTEGNVITRFFHSGSWRSKLYTDGAGGAVDSVNGQTGVVVIAQQNISGTRLVNATATGSINLDLNAYVKWAFTLTGAVNYTFTNKPTGDDVKVVEVIIDGPQPITWNDTILFDPDSDTYDGLKYNRYTFTIESDEIRGFRKNLEDV